MSHDHILCISSDVMAKITRYLSLTDVYQLMRTNRTLNSLLNSESYWKILYFNKYKYLHHEIKHYKSDYRKRSMKIYKKMTKYCCYESFNSIVVDVYKSGSDFVLMFVDEHKIAIVKVNQLKYQQDLVAVYDLPLIYGSLDSISRYLIVNNRLTIFNKQLIQHDIEKTIIKAQFQSEYSQNVLILNNYCINLLSNNKIKRIFSSELPLIDMYSTLKELYAFAATTVIRFSLKDDNQISFKLPITITSMYCDVAMYPFCLLFGSECCLYNLETNKMCFLLITPILWAFLSGINPSICFAFKDNSIRLFDCNGLLIRMLNLKSQINCLIFDNYFLIVATQFHLYIFDSASFELKIKLHLNNSGRARNDFFINATVKVTYLFSKVHEDTFEIWAVFNNGTIRYYCLSCFTYIPKKVINQKKKKTSSNLQILSQRHSRNKSLVDQVEYEQWTMEYDREQQVVMEEQVKRLNGQSQLSEQELTDIAIALSIDDQENRQERELLEELAFITAKNNSK